MLLRGHKSSIQRPSDPFNGVAFRYSLCWISAVKTKTGEYTSWIVVTNAHNVIATLPRPPQGPSGDTRKEHIRIQEMPTPFPICISSCSIPWLDPLLSSIFAPMVWRNPPYCLIPSNVSPLQDHLKWWLSATHDSDNTLGLHLRLLTLSSSSPATPFAHLWEVVQSSPGCSWRKGVWWMCWPSPFSWPWITYQTHLHHERHRTHKAFSEHLGSLYLYLLDCSLSIALLTVTWLNI